MSEKSHSKYPHVILKRIKNYHLVGESKGTEAATEFILRMDGTHGQESAIMNYVKDGCVLIGHKNLDPAKHARVIALVDGISLRNIDPRLLADKPESVLDRKVQNERKQKES